jgi:hypothetical protein
VFNGLSVATFGRLENYPARIFREQLQHQAGYSFTAFSQPDTSVRDKGYRVFSNNPSRTQRVGIKSTGCPAMGKLLLYLLT